MCILDWLQTTFFYLGRLLNKLEDNQCSAIIKDSIYHIPNMTIQTLTWEWIDRTLNGSIYYVWCLPLLHFYFVRQIWYTVRFLWCTTQYNITLLQYWEKCNRCAVPFRKYLCCYPGVALWLLQGNSMATLWKQVLLLLLTTIEFCKPSDECVSWQAELASRTAQIHS